MSLFTLQGKTALITGAASGIGKRIGEAFAQAGAAVILHGRNSETLRDACASLPPNPQASAAHFTHRFITQDLLQVSDWERFITDHTLQSVDIIVNAAGVNLRQPWDEISESDWDQTIDIHLKVPFLLSRALVPYMQKRQWGKIINLASLQSQRAFNNSIPYGTAKGGVCQMTRAMAQAWSQYGITCNAIAPGFFPTQLTQPVFSDPALSDKMAQQTAIGRNGKLQDLDGAFLLFASHASDYITGQTLFVDGGFTAK